MHSWSIFSARTNHGQTQIHKTHHGPNLREATTFPLIIFFMPCFKACTQMSFCPETTKLGVLKFLKLGLLQLWRPITTCANLRLRWSLKQSCSPPWKISNGMSQTTYMQINQGKIWLLMVKSQIDSLIRDPSFGHNLCFKYSTWSCEFISYIYISIVFSNGINNSLIQWILTPTIAL